MPRTAGGDMVRDMWTRGRRGSAVRVDPETEAGLLRIIGRTHEWLRRVTPGAPARLVGRIRLMLMLCRDHHEGRYPHIPLASLWALVFALFYVTSPLDLIPDILPGLGWLDDAFVVALVWRAVGRDLRRYCRHTGLNPRRFGL